MASLISMSFATLGTATFYTTYIPSACYGSTPEGTMIAAAGDELWDGGKICGKTFQVTCTGPTNPYPHPCKDGTSVSVKIVDQCPNCGGTLDLSKEAFSTIADPVAGVIKIDYQQ
ncbi:putative EG45-like domain containing protein 1 [Chenopodium quinoa]|uniref:putative EG45-like domain containing protein 1 n=1 Tax=Chenopodium quinoa TaxID=63459 RepID=UPI000B79A28A|nr:putative EG45-like domain containing protein 1 [Chenopodium quinoa]